MPMEIFRHLSEFRRFRKRRPFFNHRLSRARSDPSSRFKRLTQQSPRLCAGIFTCILGSPHNPKFLWVDDAEIVGDRITEVRPVPGNFFTQETERRISELGACRVAFVVRDVSVHEAPQPLDRI